MSAAPAHPKDEVHISKNSVQYNTIKYVLGLFQGKAADAENSAASQSPLDTVHLKGTGAAITNVITIAEIIRRRIKGLHQITLLESAATSEAKTKSAAGVKDAAVKRLKPAITITLSLKQLDAKHPGYQAPLDESLVLSPEQAAAAQAIAAAGRV